MNFSYKYPNKIKHFEIYSPVVYLISKEPLIIGNFALKISKYEKSKFVIV